MKRSYCVFLMFIVVLFVAAGCNAPTYSKPTGKIVINNSATCPCSLRVTLDTLDYGDIAKSKTVEIGPHTLIITTAGTYKPGCDTCTCHFTGGNNTVVSRFNVIEDEVKIAVISGAGDSCSGGLAVDWPH